jgi:hypothetical protein
VLDDGLGLGAEGDAPAPDPDDLCAFGVFVAGGAL